MNDNELMKSMPIPRAVAKMAIPSIISSLVTVVYNMADTFFIGKLNDPLQVAAATIAMPCFMLLTGFANLFGLGGSSLISRCLGMGNQEKARHCASFCIWTGAVAALLYGIAVVLLEPVLFPVLPSLLFLRSAALPLRLRCFLSVLLFPAYLLIHWQSGS